jgi:hypothetical protein
MHEREAWGRILNFAVCGVGGVLMSLLVCMGWGFGRKSSGVGKCFQVILSLRREMASRLDSEMICGVGTRS